MKKALTTLTLLSALSTATQAGVIFSDSFTYPDGPLVGAPGSPWNSHSGTAGTMLVTNDQLIVSTSRSEDVNALLSGAPYTTISSTELYSRFTVRCTGLPSVGGAYFAHFKDTNTGPATGFGARVWASTTNMILGSALSPGKFRLGLSNGAGTNGANVQFDMDLDTNVDYVVVTRFVPATGISTLWVNPNSESDTSVTATDTSTSRPNPIDVVAYAFRQASGEGTMWVDDLKVGTAFSDVAGANTAPTISSVPNQNIAAGGSTGPLSFTINDAETAADSLTVTANSDNTALVPGSAPNIVLGGSGADRTVTVSPVAGQQGAATITVSVSDGANTSFTTFVVKVGAPTISAIPDQLAYTNAAIAPIQFTVSDPESDPLTISPKSSNQSLLPDANIVLGGSGQNRTVTVTPVAGQTGVATLILSVTDGFNTNATSFTLTVSPRLGLVFGDDFAYTSFNFGLDNSLTAAVGSPWVHASPTGQNFYELQVTNGLAYLSYTNAEDVGAALTNAPFDGSQGFVFYTSFTVNFSVVPSRAGNYFLHLKSSDTDTLNFRDKIFVAASNSPAGQFRLGVANTANQPVQFPLDLNLDTTYTVVTRYNAGTGESVLWVNPVNEQSAHVIAKDSPGSSTIGGVALRQDTGIGNIAVGPIKIGTAFSDVLTAVQPPPAEPLQFQLSGNTLTLTWTNAAFSLQWATDVNGPYTKIDGATSPYPAPASGPAKFFRLAWP